MIFLLNPISGSGDRLKLRKLLERRLPDLNVDFEIHPSVSDGNYGALRSEILRSKVTDVVIAGGDGTINNVVSSLRDTGVAFGIIPCGSGNGLAFCAGIPGNTDKAVDLLFSASPKPTDAFYVNHQFSCMLSGLGFDAQVAYDFSKQNKRGLSTYVRQTIAAFLKAKPYDFEIATETDRFSKQAFFISIANSNQFGNRFTIAPKASLNDGLLDVVVVQKMNKIRMLFSVLRQIRSGQVENKLNTKRGILYFQTPGLVIKNRDAAPFHIDGDPHPAAFTLDIRVIPAAFRLIRP